MADLGASLGAFFYRGFHVPRVLDRVTLGTWSEFSTHRLVRCLYVFLARPDLLTTAFRRSSLSTE